MQTTNILDRHLNTFAVNEVTEIRRIADTVFEPILRPFRQYRMVEEFSARKTIQTAMRIGQLMPTYQKRKIEHRKSRLVIFMSLSGIDRCSAVSLIPLFGALQKSSLDFRFFVYTDDVIQAEITADGFLANDWQLAWNNVAGPVVFNKIVEMPSDEKEDTLLVIDSLGGGDSCWYSYWGETDRQEVVKEQEKYLAASGRYSWAKRIRKELNGNFSKINQVDLPEQWLKLVDNNCNKRWLETPALQQYMIRWLFHPSFGTVKHGSGKIPNLNAFTIMRKLKSKYKNLHLLTPNLTETGIFQQIKNLNVFDYHHKANTIRGFSEVLSTIVHGDAVFESKYTQKISYQVVKVGDYKAEPLEEISADDGNHSEALTAGTMGCFVNCPPVDICFPKVDVVYLSKRRRGKDFVEQESVNFSELEINYLPEHLNYIRNNWWDTRVINCPEIESTDSDYTKTTKAQNILDDIKKHELICVGSGLGGIVKRQRSPSEKLAAIFERIEFAKHHTRGLQNDVFDLLELLSPSYYNCMEELPLRHVVWCTEGKFNQKRMAISCPPDADNKRATVWHEMLHWLEAICHPVGVFTNRLLAKKAKIDKQIDLDKAIQVGLGEYAMPVQDGSTAWIKNYAGKWYRRKKQTIPNHTEILTVYGEYFSSTESLIKLMSYDPFMVRFIAFIFMGGPIAAVNSLIELKKVSALYEIQQRDRVSYGYSKKKTKKSNGNKSSYRPKGNNGFGL